MRVALLGDGWVPAVEVAEQLTQVVDDGVGTALDAGGLPLRDDTVRHQDRAHAGRLGAVDVVEQAIADEHRRGPDRCRRPPPAQPERPPGAASSTRSRCCRPLRRSGRARRRGGRSCSCRSRGQIVFDSTPILKPRSARAVNSGATERVGDGVLVPPVRSRRPTAPRSTRRRRAWRPRRGAAPVLVAAADPDRLLGQPCSRFGRLARSDRRHPRVRRVDRVPRASASRPSRR